ncbi:TetR/AcrR family transcriptional regulator [uncultured Megasphaera sp.]|uniref:TetR/AcrR family transcriptional regulator n=1 Tax=uncultured Megasphaera sp. TaxID=165188 RepID=UPI0025DD49CA|nr:TetR/AcrR family transcriptional regulator [uncultured Megasphaera sp.]
MEQKVILAALEEVKLHGLRFTMADVTRRLRMSKSSLYKLVPSKDRLIETMQSYIMDTFNAQATQIQDASVPLVTKVQQFVRAYLNMMQPLTTSGYFEDLQLLYPDEYGRWQDFYKEKVQDVIGILQEGVETGLFRPVCLPVVQHCLYVSAMALADPAFLAHYDLTYQQAVETLEDVLFHGLVAVKEG